MREDLVDGAELSELILRHVSRLTTGKGARPNGVLQNFADELLKLIDPSRTGKTQRLWARLTQGFQAECPACGGLIWPRLNPDAWDLKRQRVTCPECMKVWAVGLVFWPVVNGANAGQPDDLEPNWWQLARLREEAGSFAASVPRRKRDRVNVRKAARDGTNTDRTSSGDGLDGGASASVSDVRGDAAPPGKPGPVPGVPSGGTAVRGAEAPAETRGDGLDED